MGHSRNLKVPEKTGKTFGGKLPLPTIPLLSLKENKDKDKKKNSRCYKDSSGSWFCHNPLFLELSYICP